MVSRSSSASISTILWLWLSVKRGNATPNERGRGQSLVRRERLLGTRLRRWPRSVAYGTYKHHRFSPWHPNASRPQSSADRDRRSLAADRETGALQQVRPDLIHHRAAGQHGGVRLLGLTGKFPRILEHPAVAVVAKASDGRRWRSARRGLPARCDRSRLPSRDRPTRSTCN